MEKLYYGAEFYPELWDEGTNDFDINLMVKSGVNVVRIGEFIWGKLEKVEGEIDVVYLVEIVDKLYKNGISTILCTPTPTPPIWASFGHEERLHTDRHGRKMMHGSRQHMCTNGTYFREKCSIIIDEIAKNLGEHEGVILWQLDNEFKCHVDDCFCDTCKGLWHEWLKEKYGTIDELNEKWGTGVWSERYESFEQIPQPFESTPWIFSASLQTNYRMFNQEKISEFATMQAEIIRKHSSKPITTNSALAFTVDNEKLFENLDEAGFDTYQMQDRFHAFLINCDIYKNFKQDKGFWILETSVSHTGALNRHFVTHKKGYLVPEVVSAFCLGAKGMLFWLWRGQKSGVETQHGSVVSCFGKPTIGYEDFVKAGEEVRKIEPFLLSTKYARAEVAVTYSDKARTFMLTENHSSNDYRELMASFYKSVLETGVHRDLLSEGKDFSQYKVLISPYMLNISNDYFKKAKKFVEEGGTWIVGPLSGFRTEEHTSFTDAALGAELEKLAGVDVLYTYPLNETGAMGEVFSEDYELTDFSLAMKTTTAKSVGTIKGGNSSGLCFISENCVGKGKVVIIGSKPVEEKAEEMFRRVIAHYCEEAKVGLRLKISKGTIGAPRYDEEGNLYWVVINMDGNGGYFQIDKEIFDVTQGRAIVDRIVSVKPYEYRIFRF